jgi:hypothetical protein
MQVNSLTWGVLPEGGCLWGGEVERTAQAQWDPCTVLWSSVQCCSNLNEKKPKQCGGEGSAAGGVTEGCRIHNGMVNAAKVSGVNWLENDAENDILWYLKTMRIYEGAANTATKPSQKWWER